MVKLHIGCGNRFIPGWIHIDGENHPTVHYKLDFQDPLPFADSEVSVIYCSHGIQYLVREEFVYVLTEWKRVLCDGGILRLAVPDFAVLARLYCEGTLGLQGVVGPLYGKMELCGKDIFHKTTYDFETLKRLLEYSGFHNVHRYDWRKTEHADVDDFSQAYIPHMDKENGTLISLNVECVK